MAQAGSLERLYQRFKDRVDFLLVYIREAHPDSILAVPAEAGEKRLQIVSQTASVAERLANLRKMLSITRLSMPSVIDDEGNTIKQAYAAWPDRLYVVSPDGSIGYKGRPGPFGFRVPELEAWLEAHVR
jgi:hypothetical protein